VLLDRVSRSHVTVAVGIGTIAALLEVMIVAHTDRAWALAASALTAPVGFAMAFVVLGIQVVNPGCSYRLLRWACTGFFAAGSAAAVVFVAAYPFDYDASAPIHMAPCALAIAAAAYVIWRRYSKRKLGVTAP
jgi:hypothetical protein